MKIKLNYRWVHRTTFSLLIVLSLRATIASEQVTEPEVAGSAPKFESQDSNSVLSNLQPVADNGQTEPVDESDEVQAILQLRNSIGIRPLSGTLLDPGKDEQQAFTSSLNRVMAEPESPIETDPVTESLAAWEVDNRPLSALLREVSLRLGEKALELERERDDQRCVQLRKLARKNRKIANMLEEAGGDSM